MSGNFEQHKRAVITAFHNVVRHSSLAGTVDLQRLMMPLDQLLSQLGPGAPLDLAPLRDLLLELNAPEDAVAEAFLALKFREEALGVTVVLPPDVERLPDVKKRQLLETWQKRAQPAAQPAAAAPERRESKPEPSKVNAPPPRAPSPPKAGSLNRGLLAALGLVVVAGIGVTVYSEKTGPTPPQTVTVTDPAALVCVELLVNQGTAVCRMTKQAFEGEPEASLKKRAEATKRALAAHAVKSVLIQADGRFRARY